MSARFAFLVLFLACALAACATEHGVAIEIQPPRDPDGTLLIPAEVVTWELGLVRIEEVEGCPTVEMSAGAEPYGELGHAQSFAAEDMRGMDIGEVPVGRWAVFAIARDAACAPLLYGCSVVAVGADVPEVVVVPVEPTTATVTCGACRSCAATGCDPLATRCE